MSSEERILNGRYLLGDYIGEGAFSRIYIAYDQQERRKLAIKAVKAELNERLIDEKQIAELCSGYQAGMSIYDLFEEDGTDFLVTEYFEGGTLKSRLDRGKPVGVDETLEIMKPVLELLIELHKKGYIHCDISPDNIVFDSEGLAHLIDYGAARGIGEASTQIDNNTDTAKLKEKYAPAELYMDDTKLGPWSDIYSFCSVLYQMITARRVDNALTRLKRDRLKPISSLADINPKLEQAIMSGLSLDINKRYFSAETLYSSLYESVPISDEMRNVWGKNWVEVTAMAREERQSDRNRSMSKKWWGSCVKAFLITAIILGALLAGFVIAYNRTSVFDGMKGKLIEKQLERDWKASFEVQAEEDEWISTTSDKQIIEELSELTDNYEITDEHHYFFELTENDVKSWGHTNLRTVYGVIRVRRGTLEKLFKYKLGIEGFDYDNIGTHLNVESYSSVPRIDFDKKLKLPDDSLYFTYDPVSEYVHSITYLSSRKDIKTFMSEILPEISRDSYMTDDQIDELLDKLYEEEQTSEDGGYCKLQLSDEIEIYISASSNNKYYLTIN